MKHLFLIFVLLISFKLFAQEDESEDYIPSPTTVESMDLPTDESMEYPHTNPTNSYQSDLSKTEELVYPTPEIQYSDPNAYSAPNSYYDSNFSSGDEE